MTDIISGDLSKLVKNRIKRKKKISTIKRIFLILSKCFIVSILVMYVAIMLNVIMYIK